MSFRSEPSYRSLHALLSSSPIGACVVTVSLGYISTAGTTQVRERFQATFSLTSCAVEFRMSRDVSWQPIRTIRTAEKKRQMKSPTLPVIQSLNSLPPVSYRLGNFAMINTIPSFATKLSQTKSIWPRETPPADPEKPTIPPRNVLEHYPTRKSHGGFVLSAIDTDHFHSGEGG